MKFSPAKDYESLLIQANSLRDSAENLEKILSYYMNKDYSLSENRIQQLEELLESEKKQNDILTKEIYFYQNNIPYPTENL